MRHIILFLLSCLILGFLLIKSTFSQTEYPDLIPTIPIHKHIDSEEYGGGIQSWSMDQDTNGILHVANNKGLLQFDGNTWRLFEIPDCTKLRTVMVGRNNRIFVGGQGQVGFFNNIKRGMVFTSILDKLPPNYKEVTETWEILELADNVFINTESQLLVFGGDSIHLVELPGYIFRIFTVSQRLWVQFHNIGLFEYKDGNLFPVEETQHINGSIAILKSRNGYFIFTVDGDVYEINKDGVRQMASNVQWGTTNVVIRLHTGEYCLGTQNNGLVILDENLSFSRHYTKNSGVSNRTILALYEDRFNNLWVATNNGIDYLEMSLPLSLINEDLGLEGTGYTAMLFNDRIYLGTNNGLFVQQIGNQYNSEPPYVLLPGSEGQVYNLSRIGNKLILNHHKGAFQVGLNSLDRFHSMGSWKQLATKIPNLYLGGDYQGIRYFEDQGERISWIGDIENFTESSRVMEFENDTVLWMTHGIKGAFRLEFNDRMQLKGNITQYGIKSGFPSNDVSVYEINDQLVFAAEDGIYNFNYQMDAFEPNPFFNKWLGNDQVHFMCSNGNDAIYYIQNDHLGLLVQESFGTYRLDNKLFKHTNKFMNDDLPNITIVDDSNVLIGANEGFIHYNPSKPFTVHSDFQVLFRAVEVAITQDSIATYNPYFLENFVLSKDQSIKFRFAAPYFDGFEDLFYSYRLLPVDKEWSKWSSSGEMTYPFLASGNYTFEVKALNVYGQESTPSSFSFGVLKPWYYTNLAIVVYLFLGFAFVATILMVQRTRHVAEKSIIRKDQEEALQQKNEEITKISRRSKEEIDRLMNEKLRTEIDLKNDQLTTLTMNFMNNHEFIHRALKKIEANLEREGSTNELKNIVKSIYKSLSIDDSWDQFAYHFDQVHGDYLKKLSDNNVNLSPREIKLAAFLRMNLSSKEISKMMNITERSVELARYRLRKKLKLNKGQNLVEYLIELDNR